jgi:hypothetical protein
MKIREMGNSVSLDMTPEEALSLIADIATVAARVGRYPGAVSSTHMPAILMGKAEGGHDAPGEMILVVRNGDE